MALNARKVKNNSGPKAPLVDVGAYPARLQGVVDLGIQPQSYAGETKTPKNEIWTTYELSDEFMPGEDGEPDENKPRWFSERLALNNLDSDLAKSTKRYYALDPNEDAEGDWSKLIGNPVTVAMTVNGEYNNIGATSAMRPKEAAKLPELVNPPRLFSMDEPDVEVFLSLPQFVQDWIKGGLEFEGSKLDKLLKDQKGTPTNNSGSDKKTERKAKPATTIEDDSIPFDVDEEKTESDDGDW